MNDELRRILERRFDGEPAADDPRDAADDAESLAYLRGLSLLRELALRHDPAAAALPRRPVLIAPRSRRRRLATVLALAASVLFMALMVRFGRRDDPKPRSILASSGRPSAVASVAAGPTVSPRSPHPSLEVELYRWANESSPYTEVAAGVLLSRFASLHGRPASREILVLEAANAYHGLAIIFPRPAFSRSRTSPGSIRKFSSSRHSRPAPSPKA